MRRCVLQVAQQERWDVKARDKGCGFNRKHSEMINMPQIGTMVFLGMRLSR